MFRTLFLALALLAAAPDTALADRHRHRDRDRTEERDRDFDGGRERRSERRISLDQAVAMAERRYKAKVVRTETFQDGDRTFYRLRLMSDNRVWAVTVDAATGAMR